MFFSVSVKRGHADDEDFGMLRLTFQFTSFFLMSYANNFFPRLFKELIHEEGA